MLLCNNIRSWLRSTITILASKFLSILSTVTLNFELYVTTWCIYCHSLGTVYSKLMVYGLLGEVLLNMDHWTSTPLDLSFTFKFWFINRSWQKRQQNQQQLCNMDYTWSELRLVILTISFLTGFYVTQDHYFEIDNYFIILR